MQATNLRSDLLFLKIVFYLIDKYMHLMHNQYKKVTEFLNNSIFKQSLLSTASDFTCLNSFPLKKSSLNLTQTSHLPATSSLVTANFLILLFPCPNFPLTSKPTPNWFLPNYSNRNSSCQGSHDLHVTKSKGHF